MSRSSPGRTRGPGPASSININPQLAFLARNATPDDLHKVVGRLVDAIDGDGGAGNDDTIHEKRHVHSSKTMDGVRGSWFLDREGGETVNAALDAHLVTARSTDEKRTLAQRRADALVDICRFALNYGDHPPGAEKRRRGVPNTLMLIDIRTLEEEHADVVAGLRAEYATGGRVSQATIERILCECDISRVLLDGPSEVLDLGRTSRTPSGKQFKALVVRDGHCQGKGCKVPWQFCQPHHIKWSDPRRKHRLSLDPPIWRPARGSVARSALSSCARCHVGGGVAWAARDERVSGRVRAWLRREGDRSSRCRWRSGELWDRAESCERVEERVGPGPS